MSVLPSLVFAPGDGSASIQLNEGDKRLVGEVRGAGIVEGDHQITKTPTKRGATYVRTVLPERFLEIAMQVHGTDFDDLQIQRRLIIAALNSDLGVGVLTYTPVAGGQIYAIDCILEGGGDFSKTIGPASEELVLVLRCSDPTWYDPAINTTVEVSSVDPVDIDNDGDIETFPIIAAYKGGGSFTGPKITNTTTGKFFSLPGLVVAAFPVLLIIDMELQTAEVDGVNVMAYRSADSEQLSLLRGTNELVFSVEAGSPTVFYTQHYTRFVGV